MVELSIDLLLSRCLLESSTKISVFLLNLNSYLVTYNMHKLLVIFFTIKLYVIFNAYKDVSVTIKCTQSIFYMNAWYDTRMTSLRQLQRENWLSLLLFTSHFVFGSVTIKGILILFLKHWDNMLISQWDNILQ